MNITRQDQQHRGFGLVGRFMAFIGALVVIVTTALTVVSINSQQEIVRNRVFERSTALTSLLKSTAYEELILRDIASLRENLAHVLAQDEVVYAFAYDSEGRSLAGGTRRNARVLREADASSISVDNLRGRSAVTRGDVLDVVEPVIISSGTGGGFRVGFSLERMNNEIKQLRDFNILLGVIFGVVALMVTYLLVSRITSPIRQLTRATVDLSKGEFHQRIEISTRDELETLAEAFNTMSSNLLTSRNELIRSKEYTDNVIRSMLDMLIVTSPDGVIRTINAATCDALGYSANELIGVHVEKIIPDYPFLTTDSEAAGPTLEGRDATFFTSDGMPIETSFSGSALVDEEGQVVGYVCVARDVTAQRRADRQLRMKAGQQSAIAELGQLALSTKSIQRVMDEAVAQIAKTLDVTYNTICELLPGKNALLIRAGLGWPSGVVGKEWVSADVSTQVGYTLSVSRPVVLENLKEERRFTGADIMHRHGIVSGASVVIHGTDEPFGVLAAHSPERRSFTEDDINFLQSVANVISMTLERNRQEARLVAAKEEAEEMSRLKSSFLANMSHEIRTPLTIMIGYAEALSEVVPEEHRTFVERIEGGGQRLFQTLNSVLELSRLQAKEMKLNLEDLVITSEVRDAVSHLQPMATARNLEIVVEAPDDLPATRVDRGALTRIIDNLVGNAIKFTRQGGIYVDLSAVGDRVYLKVRDTGIGISAEFLPHLFDEFKQESTGDARTHEGSGLGLAITRQLVELHGGRISVESEKSVGTTFTVWLPASPNQESADRLAPAGDRPAKRQFRSAANGTPHRRALLVEDSLETQDLVRFHLEPHFDLTIVKTADEAFARTWEGSYDLILLDINLGDEQWSGLDVLTVLRNLPKYASTPIIAITAYALPGDNERFIEAGFSSYVAKPFVRDHLMDEIERLLGQAGSEPPPTSANQATNGTTDHSGAKPPTLPDAPSQRAEL